MLLIAVVILPTLAAAAAYVITDRGRRSTLLVATAAVHLACVAALWRTPDRSVFDGWLAVDALGLVVLTLESLLFAAVASYALGFLRTEKPRGGRAFVSCLLVFLGAASLVCVSHHLAVLWVGMETTTLAVAPLVFHRRDRRSLEAVWKYLMLSSVGIAFALLAIFLLADSQPSVTGGRPLLLPDLLQHAALLDHRWLRLAFAFALVGFGTKMGLAPLHTWKPDTYGEAPSLVGGLMAGGLTSVAFLGIARFTQVAIAAGLADFARPLLVAFGLLSIAVATAFILGQADIKRLLAYSSVEHMGLLVLGLGIGGAGAYGAVLHVLNNGLLKGALFLVVGNIVLAANTSVVAELKGMLRRRPVSAALLVCGLFAVTGTPPFGLFISEYSIIVGAVRQDRLWIAIALVVMLSVIFVGLASMILDLVWAEAGPVGARTERRESAWLVAGPLTLVAIVLALGLYIPAPLQEQLQRAAATLGGSAP
ncbi:MAG TPA: proton-conducting transporter membrane subunit [Gemmatimonadaceae bacterium]